MICYMDVMKAVISSLSPGQVSIITCDQSLYQELTIFMNIIKTLDCAVYSYIQLEKRFSGTGKQLKRAGLKLGWVNLHMSM